MDAFLALGALILAPILGFVAARDFKAALVEPSFSGFAIAFMAAICCLGCVLYLVDFVMWPVGLV